MKKSTTKRILKRNAQCLATKCELKSVCKKFCFYDTERDKKPRDGFVFVTFVTPAEAEANIAKAMKKWPHITLSEARILIAYQGSKDWSSKVVDSSGGGRLPAYMEQIGVKH